MQLRLGCHSAISPALNLWLLLAQFEAQRSNNKSKYDDEIGGYLRPLLSPGFTEELRVIIATIIV